VEQISIARNVEESLAGATYRHFGHTPHCSENASPDAGPATLASTLPLVGFRVRAVLLCVLPLVLLGAGCANSDATPLLEAASRGDFAEVRERIAAGDDLDQLSPPFEFTALMEAAGRSDQIVELLLAAGADPNVRGREGWTALAFAAYRRSVTAVELLLSAGADVQLQPISGDAAGRSICSMAGGPETEVGALVC